MQEIVARLLRLPDDTLTALAFFSRVPVPRSQFAFDMKTGAAAWPISGLILALGPALLFLAARAAAMPPFVAAALALALYAALTGAMHEDGLSDTFDGLGGGRSRGAKLAIMRDSRLGTFGALALLFATLIKLGSLSAIGLRPTHAVLALLAAAVLSRALAIWHWGATAPARRDGMAVSAGRPDGPALTIGLALGAIAALALFWGFGAAALAAVALAVIGIWLFSRIVERQIGGHSGDTVGAAQQIAETLLYAALTIGGPSILT